MPLKRVEHWAERALHQFLVERAVMPFAYGSNDCCLFAADAIQAITGTDIADDFRGKYTDESSAFAAIKSITGGETVADAAAHCAAKHGLEEWSKPLFAKRGDLVVVQDAGRPIAGVVHLNGRHVVSVGEKGLMRLPITSVLRAWKV